MYRSSFVYKLWLAGLILLFLCLIGLSGGSASRQHSQPQLFSKDKLESDFLPVRGELRTLRLHRTGFKYQCGECHGSFKSKAPSRQRVAEHVDLHFDHGSNDYCLNCHHETNRDAYATYNGGEIPSDKPEKLCAKCHGPVFSDWKAGIHGRQSAFGNPESSERKQLTCIQCHDPHTPKFKQIAPMPGPQIPQRYALKEKHG